MPRLPEDIGMDGEEIGDRPTPAEDARPLPIGIDDIGADRCMERELRPTAPLTFPPRRGAVENPPFENPPFENPPFENPPPADALYPELAPGRPEEIEPEFRQGMFPVV